MKTRRCLEVNVWIFFACILQNNNMRHTSIQAYTHITAIHTLTQTIILIILLSWHQRIVFYNKFQTYTFLLHRISHRKTIIYTFNIENTKTFTHTLNEKFHPKNCWKSSSDTIEECVSIRFNFTMHEIKLEMQYLLLLLSLR